MNLWSDDERTEAKRLLSDLGRDFKAIADKLNEIFENDRSPKAVRTQLEYYSDGRTELSQMRKENAALRQALRLAQFKQKVNIHDYEGDWIRFGVISDVHLGSVCEVPELLALAYDMFERENISRVYLPGDLVDGRKMYSGHEFEIRVHGCDEQRDYTVATFPRKHGITTYLLQGNHDASFWKQNGTDICEKIAALREDIMYLGPVEQDIIIRQGSSYIRLRLVHPGGGTAYAISYQAQTYVRSLTGGEKPNIILFGHYHKWEHLVDRNIEIFQCGTLQKQTKYMKEHKAPAHMGFSIIELRIKDRSILRCRGEFFPWYVEEEPVLELDD